MPKKKKSLRMWSGKKKGIRKGKGKAKGIKRRGPTNT
ncbi:hypothetical protein LCGC14_1632190 [marine sediment metagenome]|uniref:Uncharacterized protein n=1 Tax=marine sediment metagenome TaxID=412755 RepID=A0A0F9IPI1_9ZZZZ